MLMKQSVGLYRKQSKQKVCVCVACSAVCYPLLLRTCKWLQQKIHVIQSIFVSCGDCVNFSLPQVYELVCCCKQVKQSKKPEILQKTHVKKTKQINLFILLTTFLTKPVFASQHCPFFFFF